MKDRHQTFTYCVFCVTGKESKVEAELSAMGFNVITSLSERYIIRNGLETKTFRPIIPGYVFFTSNDEPDWNNIKKIENIIYPLSYSDKSKALKQNDLDFVAWLLRQNGIIGMSKVIETGTKIEIIEGPLKEYEGSIINFKKRQKCACVEINYNGIINKIWLSYEIMKPII